MTSLHVDFETRSVADLKKTGAYAYAADPSTDIWCMAYAFGDGPVEVWTPGRPVVPAIVEHVMLGGALVAHNASFERIIWHCILGPRYGFPEPAVEQWTCTMAMAYALAFPGSLENAAAAAGLDIGKDMTGRRLMMQMARPRKVEADGTITWWDEPAKVERLIAYCRTDVEVERALEKRLRPLSKSEQALWHLDQRVNDRGVLVDEALCTAAKGIVKQAQADLDSRMRALTGHSVSQCSNRNELVAWVREQGVECESVNKAALEELLEGDDSDKLPDHVRDVLLVRQEAAKASVAKIDALLHGKSPEDDRAKGLLQFHAASTGRWSGRRFQPQNLKRPEHEDMVPAFIDALAAGDGSYIEMMGVPVLSAIGDSLRGMLISGPNARIMAADYSAIEGRVLPWLAGEDWKLAAYREFDASVILDEHCRPLRVKGEKQFRLDDMYCVTASALLGFRVAKKTHKKERQNFGKVPELAFGYQGGYGAWLKFASGDALEYPRAQVDEIKDGWREKHPRIKQFWYDMEEAAVAAVRNRGSVVRCGRIHFKMAGSWLFMRLPSGRFLAYPYPEVREFDVPWGGTKAGLTYFSTIDVSKKAKVVDDPKNSSNWARIKTYGGMLVENATQAVARDVMAHAMPRLEAAGYPIVLTVHDEIVCEVPAGHGSVDEMEAIMCDLPAWAAGLPVAAEGFEGERYRK